GGSAARGRLRAHRILARTAWRGFVQARIGASCANAGWDEAASSRRADPGAFAFACACPCVGEGAGEGAGEGPTRGARLRAVGVPGCDSVGPGAHRRSEYAP